MLALFDNIYFYFQTGDRYQTLIALILTQRMSLWNCSPLYKQTSILWKKLELLSFVFRCRLWSLFIKKFKWFFDQLIKSANFIQILVVIRRLSHSLANNQWWRANIFSIEFFQFFLGLICKTSDNTGQYPFNRRRSENWMLIFWIRWFLKCSSSSLWDSFGDKLKLAFWVRKSIFSSSIDYYCIITTRVGWKPMYAYL